ARLDATNHFIDGESERAIRVEVAEGVAIRGKLKIASAYGAETRYVDVEVVEPEEEEESVTVDESLAQPQTTTEPEDSELSTLVESPETVVLALGAVAIFVAAVAAVVINRTVVTLGALAVLAAVLAAMYVLVSES
ncbi:MAG: hypothetical protein ABEJ85_02380, partial [Haloarculaceae archaeon]